VKDELWGVLNAIREQPSSGLLSDSVRERGRALARFVPDEDTPSKPGLSDLIDGVTELSKLLDTLTPLKALDIAGYGYQAAASVALPRVSGGEAAFLAAERAVSTGLP
jgi:hypothetical protein